MGNLGAVEHDRVYETGLELYAAIPVDWSRIAEPDPWAELRAAINNCANTSCLTLQIRLPLKQELEKAKKYKEELLTLIEARKLPPELQEGSLLTDFMEAVEHNIAVMEEQLERAKIRGKEETATIVPERDMLPPPQFISPPASPENPRDLPQTGYALLLPPISTDNKSPKAQTPLSPDLVEVITQLEQIQAQLSPQHTEEIGPLIECLEDDIKKASAEGIAQDAIAIRDTARQDGSLRDICSQVIDIVRAVKLPKQTALNTGSYRGR